MNTRKIITCIAISILFGCSQEEPKKEVEAFIVTGAGSGVPLSGRKLVGLDETFLPKISTLKGQYTQELNELIDNAINNNKPLQDEIKDSNQLVISWSEEISINQKRTAQEIKSIQDEMSLVTKSKSTDFQQYVNETKAPILKSLKILEKDLIHINKITKKYKSKTKKFTDAISKREAENSSNVETIKNNGMKISKLASKYIIDNELNETLPPKIVDVKETYSKNEYNYITVNPSPSHRIYPNIKTVGVSKSVGGAISKTIDPLMKQNRKLQVRNKTLYSELSSLKTKKRNATVSIKNKYSGDEILMKYSGRSKYSDIDNDLKTATTSINNSIVRIKSSIRNIDSPEFLKSIVEIKRSELTNKIKMKEAVLAKKNTSIKLDITALQMATERSKSSAIIDEKYKLIALYDEKLEEVLINSTQYTLYTGLNGNAELTSEGSYIYMVANRMSDEEFTWLIKPNFVNNKHILANHNVSYKGTSFGVWVFDYLEQDIETLKNSKNQK